MQYALFEKTVSLIRNHPGVQGPNTRVVGQ